MSTKKKKVVKDEPVVSGSVVTVLFNANTAYGQKNTVGFMPSGFADAWFGKGLVSFIDSPEEDSVEVSDDSSKVEGFIGDSDGSEEGISDESGLQDASFDNQGSSI